MLSKLSLALLTSAIAGTAWARAPLFGDYAAPHCTTSIPNVLRMPVLVGPLYDGDTKVHVLNQSPGATINIISLALGNIGSATAKNGTEFDTTVPLVTGDQIRICQMHAPPVNLNLCEISYTTVLAAPASLEAPRFVYVTIEAGARSIALGGIHPGAEVVVEIGGVEQARKRAHSNATSIQISTSLAVGTQLDIYQTIDTVVSPTTSKVLSAGVRPVNTPRILGPIQAGDTGVWVSNVTPGTLVEIVAGGTVLGSKEMGESMGMIPTCPLSGLVQSQATRDGLNYMTSFATPFSSYGAPGTHSEIDIDFGPMATLTDASVPRKGRYYAPNGAISGVIFMMHGDQPPGPCDLFNVGGTLMDVGFEGDSYLGYEYVADPLADLGFAVISLAVERSDLAVESRVQLFEQIVDDVLNAGWPGVTPDLPVGLFGHSMGGDAAIAYASQAPSWVDIRGVFVIAPASHGVIEPVVGLDPPEGVTLFHLMGSEDYFFENPGTAFLRSIEQYDTAWKSKSQAMLEGAGHNCFNACWCLTNPAPNTLSEVAHQEVVKLYAKPFFHGLLRGAPDEFAPYFGNQVRPKGLYEYDLTMQHHEPAGAFLVDNFGDPQTEVSVLNNNQSTSVNSRGGAITEVNAATARSERTHLNLEGSLGVPYQAEHLGGNRALLVKWNAYNWEYTSTIPNNSLSAAPTDYLSFRVMAVAGDNANDLAGDEGYEQDLIVTISDLFDEGRVRVGAAAPIPYPYLDLDGDRVHVFGTVRIPMDAFKASAANLNLGNIRNIKFRSAMRDEGRLLIDDVEIVRR